MMRQTWAAIALLLALLPFDAAHAQGDPFLTVSTASALESSHVICASRCRLQSGYAVSTSASAAWLMVFDAASVPNDGSVTANTVKDCVPIPAGSFGSIKFEVGEAKQYANGVVAVLSSTNCATKTAIANGWFSFRVLQQ